MSSKVGTSSRSMARKQRCFLCGPTVALIMISTGVLALISVMLVSIHSDIHENNLKGAVPIAPVNVKEVVATNSVPPIIGIATTPPQSTSVKTPEPVQKTVESDKPSATTPEVSSAVKLPPVPSGPTMHPSVSPNLTLSSPLNPFRKKKGAIDLHFIHIPKCGGTSMTAILREVACVIDPERNQDCCTNPGFCDWHAFRRCESIRGCTNHVPNRPWIFKKVPSITILREPISRILSAWFYRGHSPNLDFFQVRPYFKQIAEGKMPRAEFPEYMGMHEYQNIQTRMLGADSFPYRNITVTDKVFEAAVEALNSIFFVGVQEAYELSVKVLLRELNVPLVTEIKKERDQQSSKRIAKQKEALKNNQTMMAELRVINHYDIKLYKLGVQKFCKTAKKYSDLYDEIKKTTKVDCDAALSEIIE